MEKPQAESTNGESFLLIHNVAKPKNIGLLLQSAVFFNVSTIFLIAKKPKKPKEKKPQNEESPANAKEKKAQKERIVIEGLPKCTGDRGCVELLNFRTFKNMNEFRNFCKTEGIWVMGIEIGEGCKPVTQNPFRQKTCFILGNEGQGLMQKLKDVCDDFVYIPHYSNKTGSLNVATAGAIILERFAEWAQFARI